MNAAAGGEGDSGPPGAWLGHGVRALEAGLLAAVQRELARAVADERLLAAPVRVVVPSRSLRIHVSSRLVAALGRPAPGLKVQTLAGLATEIVERAGEEDAGASLVPLLVRREARAEPALARHLDAFADAYGAAVAGVDDLLDAGLEVVHADALLERIEALELGRDAAERARALVRVAARVAEAFAEGWLSHRSRSFVLARDCVEREPATVAARAVLVYGFADATGVQTDLLESLVRLAGARILLDQPPDPAAPLGVPLCNDFGAPFRDRVTAAGGLAPLPEGPPGPPPAPPAVLRLAAPDRGAETRAVALRLRQALDAGVPAERMAVVARDLEPYRLLLRSHLTGLGVPFSGVDEPGAATAVRRRLAALRELLRAGPEAPADLWLDALVRIRAADGRRRTVAATHRADLRYALHTLGVVRLEGVARLDAAVLERGVRLRAVRGLRPPSGDRGAGASVRRVAREALEACTRSAGALLDRLGSRPSRAPLDAHRRWLRAVALELGWTRSTPGRVELDVALAGLRAPDGLEIEGDEFALLWERAIEAEGVCPIGGAGGGVQVLSVMEARGRSFDRLFLVGASRGAFPRSVREDPLLPDSLRLRLREVLPDLPVKREGFDEERYLFAQLLSAAPELTLSYPERGDESRPLPRSPLLDALERGGLAMTSESAPALRSRQPGVGPAEPAADRALHLALHAGRPAFARALGVALEAARAGAGVGLDPARLVSARLAVLDELDRLRRDPGPYLGFVGAPRLADDPRRGRLYVTTAENLGRCPWQAFLTRVLGLSPRVDAGGELPSARGGRLLGNAVHRALDRVVDAPAGEIDAALLASTPRRPDWPDPARLDDILRASAEHVLREAAVPVAGFSRVLARRARLALERARELDWCDGPPPVLAAEVTGAAQVAVDGQERPLYFKVDRLDRVEGGLRFTDYKSGAPGQQEQVRNPLAVARRRAIASGRSLQTMAYARAGGEGAEGRYLFLAEDLDDDVAVQTVSDAAPLNELFDTAAVALFRAWDAGSFPPRLRRPELDQEPRECSGCEVKEACLRGDSGARRRLGHWGLADAAEPAGDGAVDAARALLQLGAPS